MSTEGGASILRKAVGLWPKAPESVEWEMHRQDWVAVLASAFAAFMALLDIQVTNASMREIQNNLGIDLSEGGWISTAYLVAEIMVIPLAPILVGALGLRNYLVGGCLLFAGTSAVCSAAWDLPSIAAFRFLQGIAGGTLIPIVLQMIMVNMPAHRRNTGLAIFGLVATLAPSLGPSIGGFLTTTFGWRSVFLVNLLPSLLIVWLALRSLPVSYPSARALKDGDWTGALFLCSSVGCLTFMLEEGVDRGWLQDPLIAACAAVSALGLGAFVWWEPRQAKPLIQLELFKDPAFSLSALITFLTAQCLYGGMYALSVFLGGIRGLEPTQIGGILSWAGIPQLAVIPFVPLLMRKTDSRVLASAGLLLFAGSNFLNTGINEDYGDAEFRWSLVLRALSQPFFVIPLSAMAIQKVPPSRAGSTSSLINMIRNLGGSVGIAFVSYVIKNRVQGYELVLRGQLEQGNRDFIQAVYAVKASLWSLGQDPAHAEAVTSELLRAKILREAYFHCFIEVFAALFLLLVAAAVLSALIPYDREAVQKSAGGGGAH